ncbi:SCO family protein [Enterovirga aerilata]|uniref:SCO family protein n=1 Tax=Enterovirga aerilata TaxID=2730920 RepID=A0A849I968_9HYPH|nr:SCO family protein [Enterovirga sp. DB1703]NNM73938.1 SCO family protein [Enterovirga sp. DB1703]
MPWKTAGLCAVALAAGASLGLYREGLIFREAGPSEAAAPARGIGGSFALTSHRGDLVTDATLKGRPFLMFFGFTHCPVVCPTTLFDVTELLRELGPEADRLQALFVTVDPERDTPEILTEYMRSFDERIMALRGTPAQTDAVVRAFGAEYRKVATGDGSYTVDHTATVYVMDREGRLATTLDMHEPRDTRLAKLRRIAGPQS